MIKVKVPAQTVVDKIFKLTQERDIGELQRPAWDALVLYLIKHSSVSDKESFDKIIQDPKHKLYFMEHIQKMAHDGLEIFCEQNSKTLDEIVKTFNL